jgi:hypothetical protein
MAPVLVPLASLIALVFAATSKPTSNTAELAITNAHLVNSAPIACVYSTVPLDKPLVLAPVSILKAMPITAEPAALNALAV